MGQIKITVWGSFFGDQGGTVDRSFSASTKGHVDAICRAATWLMDQIPDAIELDHKLHEERCFPDNGFGLKTNVLDGEGSTP